MEQRFTGLVKFIRNSVLTPESFIISNDIQYEDYNGNPEFELQILNKSRDSIFKILVYTKTLIDYDLDLLTKSKIESQLEISDVYTEFTKFNSRKNILQFLVKCDQQQLDEITINYFKCK